MSSALGREARMAVKLRASEKRILERTIAAVNDELQKLPEKAGAPDVDGNAPASITAAGRSFDTLVSRASVASVKSPADWVTFKDVKKEVSNIKGPTKVEPIDKAAVSSVAERRRRRRG